MAALKPQGVKFWEVTERHERVAIVASGPSARGLVIPEGVTVIAVNGAIEWLNRADYWFTLDPDKLNRKRMMARKPGVRYYAAVPSTFGTRRAPLASMRGAAPPGIRYLYRITGNGVLGACPGLSDDPGQIHTGNSAYGALGLAYLFGASRVALFGVDATLACRIEGGRPGDLRHLPDLFKTAGPQLKAAGCSVITASLNNRFDCFPRMGQARALAWLLE